MSNDILVSGYQAMYTSSLVECSHVKTMLGQREALHGIDYNLCQLAYQAAPSAIVYAYL